LRENLFIFITVVAHAIIQNMRISKGERRKIGLTPLASSTPFSVASYYFKLSKQ